MNPVINRAANYIASALLLQRKEISVEDIRAFPLYMSDEDVFATINFLQNNFDVEVYLKKVSSYPLLEWEEIIKLKE